MPTRLPQPNARTLAAIQASYTDDVEQVESIEALVADPEPASDRRKLSAKVRVSRRGKRMCYRVPVANFSEALMKGWTVLMDPPMVCERLPNGDLRVVS